MEKMEGSFAMTLIFVWGRLTHAWLQLGFMSCHAALFTALEASEMKAHCMP